MHPRTIAIDHRTTHANEEDLPMLTQYLTPGLTPVDTREQGFLGATGVSKTQKTLEKPGFL